MKVKDVAYKRYNLKKLGKTTILTPQQFMAEMDEKEKVEYQIRDLIFNKLNIQQTFQFAASKSKAQVQFSCPH